MIYFDNSSTSYPKAPGVSAAVAAAIDGGFYNPGRGSYAGAWQTAQSVFETRNMVARLFGTAKSKHVIFTAGATMALNMAIKGTLECGGHAVTTMMDHNAVLRPLWQMQAQGAHFDIAACDGEGRLLLEDFEKKLRGDTQLVVMTHASNVCGSVQPIKEVGAICRERGILFAVDCAQSGGVLPIDMEAAYIDMLVFAGHKGLLGPQGIGGLVLSDLAAQKLYPILSGGTGSFSNSIEVPDVLPDRFEAGTLNLPGIAGLKAALEFLEATGIDAIRSHEQALLGYFMEGCKGIRGVRLLGPPDAQARCAVVSIDFAGKDNGEMAFRLEEAYGIMTRSGLHCAPYAHRALGTFPQGTVRCSFGYGNTNEEVDVLLRACKALSQ